MSRLLKQRYFIINELGRGGMGVVYKARDNQLGDRLVAVKEIGQNNPSQKAVDAFKREAEMLAHLIHPNLPSIHEHFAEAGCWYLVMEFIEGETLKDYVEAKGGWLPLKEVLDIGIQLCTVLDYLHTREPPIIFRDLKPLNVMRSPDGHLYLIDFGIARHFKLGQARDTSLALSVGYAAPEQYPLQHTQTTPQSDIYSLGATLHLLLTGNEPSSNTPTLFDFPPLQLHGQTVSTDLEILIMQMVEKVSSKRPTSMAEVKLRLQRIAAQQAMEQTSPSRSGRKTPSIAKQQSPTPVEAILSSRDSRSGGVISLPNKPSQPAILPTAPSKPQSLERPISRRRAFVVLAGLVVVCGGFIATEELVNKFNYDQNHLGKLKK